MEKNLNAASQPPATPNRPAGPPAGGYLLLASLILFWGLNFPAMKVVLGQLEPWTFRTLCLGLGGIGLLTICRLNGMSLAVPPSDRRILILAALFNITGWHLSSAFGVSLMQAGRAMILAYTMPLWASLLGIWVLNERLSGRRSLGLVLGVGGILVLLWPDRASLLQAPQGVGFMLMAAWCWAVGTVLIKRGPWHISLVLVAGWMFLLGGIPVLIGMLLWGSPSQLFAPGRQGLAAHRLQHRPAHHVLPLGLLQAAQHLSREPGRAGHAGRPPGGRDRFGLVSGRTTGLGGAGFPDPGNPGPGPGPHSR